MCICMLNEIGTSSISEYILRVSVCVSTGVSGSKWRQLELVHQRKGSGVSVDISIHLFS